MTTTASGIRYWRGAAETRRRTPWLHNMDPCAYVCPGVILCQGDADCTWDLFETDTPSAEWAWDAVSLRCGGTFNQHFCNPLHLQLKAGEHQITFRTRDSNTRLAKVVITTDLDPRPPFTR